MPVLPGACHPHLPDTVLTELGDVQVVVGIDSDPIGSTEAYGPPGFLARYVDFRVRWPLGRLLLLPAGVHRLEEGQPRHGAHHGVVVLHRRTPKR